MGLFEMPKIVDLPSAKSALNAIVDALIHMQYSGRDEGRSNAARRKTRTKLNAYADEFQAICNSMARRYPRDEVHWVKLRDRMAEEKQSLVKVKDHIMDQEGVW
tara:strand:- start:546 stop:857 length:312 start_codon:yes stop_codon:yes gene_type:complete